LPPRGVVGPETVSAFDAGTVPDSRGGCSHF
jgi:hypothetical protein